MILRIYKKLSLITVFIFVSSAIIAGCGKGNEKQKSQLQSEEQQKQQEEEPKKLQKIETRLEALFETLGGPFVKIKDSEGESEQTQENTEDQGTQQQGTQQQGTQQQGTQQQGTQQQGTQQQGTQQQSTQQQGTQQQGTQQQGTQQQGTQQQSTQQQGTQQQGTQQQGTQQQGTQQQGTQQQGTQQQGKDVWPQIGMLINNLHYQWNEFMPEIAKKGVDMKIVDNFDNALNELTTTVSSKDIKRTLTSANKLYSYIPDIYSLYRSKMSPEAKRMVYYARNIILDSAEEKWEQVIKDNEALEKSWSLFRNTLEKEQQDIGDKLNFSIYELKKVVSEKSKQLTDIKGKIVLSNIKELQKSFKEKK